MNDIAIKVENISKRYRIGVKEELHDSFCGVIFDFIRSPLNNYRKYRSLYRFDDNHISYSDSTTNNSDIIWALKDVSFEVRKGEALGIIGRNGAGKSTLLKVLSRITDPTSGYAEIRGRVSSLLEVGTGFHPELTGRENVYLNGTILGMTKKEVDSSFDEIVEFSGVEKFIDTPVKRYSSGMQVRLAFSVAAHLDPEILIIDEVLAVGDAAFQKKCLGKMEYVAKKGRTVLFVSHNLAAITQLCGRAFLLEGGELKLTGSPPSIVASYLGPGAETTSIWTHSSTRPCSLEVQVKSVRILSECDLPTAAVEFDKKFKVEIAYEVIESIRGLVILFRLNDLQGDIIWTSWDTDSNDWDGRVREPGRYLSICKVPGCLLKPNRYTLSVESGTKETTISHNENVLIFDVSAVGYNLNAGRKGRITPLLDWEVVKIDE